eukprot:GHVQ01021924.1.p1 GENE.GHVQ01021924.1~~GHVQ01021924.1.p1  ORF type:complete len:628 (-),score=153.38 GHVQ01021924.1:708-2591(-)
MSSETYTSLLPDSRTSAHSTSPESPHPTPTSKRSSTPLRHSKSAQLISEGGGGKERYSTDMASDSPTNSSSFTATSPSPSSLSACLPSTVDERRLYHTALERLSNQHQHHQQHHDEEHNNRRSQPPLHQRESNMSKSVKKKGGTRRDGGAVEGRGEEEEEGEGEGKVVCGEETDQLPQQRVTVDCVDRDKDEVDSDVGGGRGGWRHSRGNVVRRLSDGFIQEEERNRIYNNRLNSMLNANKNSNQTNNSNNNINYTNNNNGLHGQLSNSVNSTTSISITSETILVDTYTSNNNLSDPPLLSPASPPPPRDSNQLHHNHHETAQEQCTVSAALSVQSALSLSVPSSASPSPKTARTVGGGRREELTGGNREGEGGDGLSMGKDNTPHAGRIQRLSQRLSGIHVGLENERQARDSLRKKLGVLEHNFDDMKAQQETLYSGLRKQISDLFESMDREANERTRYQLLKNKQLDDLAARVSETVESQQEQYTSWQQKCKTEFEDKTKALREELLKEHMNLVDTQALIQQYCNVEIPKLNENLRQESQERSQMEERILKEASTHISGVSEMLQKEQKDRESQSQSMLHLIEQVVSKTQAQLQKERDDREATESTLFQLLEDTISKLDAATQLQ